MDKSEQGDGWGSRLALQFSWIRLAESGLLSPQGCCTQAQKGFYFTVLRPATPHDKVSPLFLAFPP